MSEESSKSLDYILSNIVGGCGKWQIQKLAVMSFVIFVCDLPLLIHMFAAYTPMHRCKVEVCESQEPDSNLFNQSWISFALPTGKQCFLCTYE